MGKKKKIENVIVVSLIDQWLNVYLLLGHQSSRILWTFSSFVISLESRQKRLESVETLYMFLFIVSQEFGCVCVWQRHFDIRFPHGHRE